jgi:hypothetical protein
VPITDRGNEITLVNLFSLRFAKMVKSLKERYQRAAVYGQARTMLEVHSEGDGAQFPDLFIADGGVIRDQARPILLLGEALGVVKQGTNPATGKSQVTVAPRMRTASISSRCAWAPISSRLLMRLPRSTCTT